VSDESDYEVLKGRLRAVEDELSIARLLAGCAHAIDYGDEAASLDSFTDDATWEGKHLRSGKSFILHHGRAELEEFFHGHTRAPQLYHKHFVGDIRAEVSGDEASATSYSIFVLSGPGGIPALGGFGRYFDELRRCADGKWRITSRLAEVESWNPLAEELMRTHRPGR
jgi:ketosteroid isomerase-like protein